MATIVHTRDIRLAAISPRVLINDSNLTPPEKPAAVQNYNTILAEQPVLDAQAVLYAITTERTDYNNAVSSLTTYLGTIPGWNVIPGTNVPIVGTTYRSTWQAVETAKSSLLSAINTVISNNTPSSAAPQPPTSFTAAAEPFGIRLKLVESTSNFVAGYEYKESGIIIEQLGGSSFLLRVQATGTYNFTVAAISSRGVFSTSVATSIILTNPTISGLAATITGPNVYLQWSVAAGSFAVAGYRIKYGSTYATAVSLDTRQVTSYTERATFLGSRTYWVAAVDVNGNEGTPVQVSATVTAPSAVTLSRAEIVDNNVLLFWTASTIGLNQLPIDYYDVKKGAVYASAVDVGSNADSTFTSIFEQQGGTNTYWITPTDTAGNTGLPSFITAAVNQPPDYILRNNYNSDLAGGDPPSLAVTSIKTNFYTEPTGTLLGPVNITETWATHFSSRGWLTVADQIAAGFSIYSQPSLTTGTYEEVLDYGAPLPPTVVTATISTTTITGSVSVVCTISWKLNLGDAWTELPVGATNGLLPSFRYVRVVYLFTCTAGANLIRINSLNVKLAIKTRTDNGAGTVTDTVNGVVVPFTFQFISADTPVVQPNGSQVLIPVVIYAGTAYPTNFTVKLYTLAGASTTGSFSWSARGY